MALLQNGSLFSAEPITRIGGVDRNSTVVPWGLGGLRFSRWYGAAGFVTYLGVPPGYPHPDAWILAIEPGGIYINRGDMAGTGGITAASMAQGRALTVSTINGLATVTTTGVGAIAAVSPTITVTSTMTPTVAGGQAIALTMTGTAAVTTSVDAVAAVVSSIPITVAVTVSMAQGRELTIDTINGLATVTTGGVGAVAAVESTITAIAVVTTTPSGAVAITLTMTGTSAVTPDVGAKAAVVANIPITVAVTAAGRALVALQMAINAVATMNITAGGGYATTSSIAGTSAVTVEGAAAGIISSQIVIPALPTAQDVAYAVWGAVAVNNNVPGSMGHQLNAAGTAGDPWSTALSGPYPPGSAGYLLAAVEQLMDVPDGVAPGVTLRQAIRGTAEVAMGKTSIKLVNGVRHMIFRDLADTKDAVDGTMVGGTRTNVDRDLE